MKKWLFVGHLYVAEKIVGLRQVLNQPVKHAGNPVLAPDRSWEDRYAYVYGRGSVVYDREEELHKMWYQAGTGGNLICYATSSDGAHWDKPDLGAVTFQGSLHNNVVLKGEYFAHNPSVVKDLQEPDEWCRYKALYWDGGREFADESDKRNMGLYVAFSSDGIHWRKYRGNPVLPEPAVGDVKVLMGWDPRIKKWVATTKRYLMTPRVRMINRTESEDFIHWSDPVPILAPDEEDPPRSEFYGMPVMMYEGAYLGFLWVYHNSSGDQTVDVQLAYSEDGLLWQRAGNREVFLPTGSPGEWDDSMIYCTQPRVVDDQIQLYYAGSNRRHDGTANDVREETEQRSCTGLATLRLDGFVSLEAAGDDSFLLTRPFVFVPPRIVDPDKKRHLVINADARDGSIKVGIIAGGEPATGFTLTDCEVFSGDSVRHTVRWHGEADISSFAAKEIQIRFVMSRAKLFSFAVKCVEATEVTEHDQKPPS